MISENIKKIHIIGIGGCASSAIAQYLLANNVVVTGSERMERADLDYLKTLGATVIFGHDKNNLYIENIPPDIVLYSPAVKALDSNNVELVEATKQNIKTMSWETFIGEYLNSLGKIGITISGSEGKGTTGAILATLLRQTIYDPMVLLGAKMKLPNGQASNIYLGNGKAYILEGDEYNHNFYAYHPSINVTVNFKYEHPETYKDFDDYKSAFAHFFSNMNGDNFAKTLILRASKDTVDLVERFGFNKTHKIIWFGNHDDLTCIKSENVDKYEISDVVADKNGTDFCLTEIKNEQPTKYEFHLNVPPRFLVYNAAGAIIASLQLGLSYNDIQQKLATFKSMVRRFDVTKIPNADGVIITDYGHSPESIQTIIDETSAIYPDLHKHFIFQPHLFSRTYTFKDDFANVLSRVEKVSLVEIYPAREKLEDWKDKINSQMIVDLVRAKNPKCDTFYCGEAKDIAKTLKKRLDKNEVTVLIGAGDMDIYYGELISEICEESKGL